MIVLGIDPGTRHFGWGIVERCGSRLVHRAHGVIHADERAPIASRLVTIERDLMEVVCAHGPAVASVEGLFYAKDAQAAAKLGHARGVALLVCARAGLAVHEYAPALVKRVVAGSGRAEKAQVARMIQVILGLTSSPAADAADALALAVTFLQHVRLPTPADIKGTLARLVRG
ncbi:MAG: crossover junction endodeoxyribonuclease RuvC [Myxococcota bacterium]|nr:crossover junction endodeoxyribonuclease RuvC [Myxococcota bacterium]